MKTVTIEELSDILQRHLKYLRTGIKEHCANLSDTNLRGAYLRGANLSSANLSTADLSGADLRGANLQGADLRGANLSNAGLSDADLSNTDLRGADLNSAYIQFCSGKEIVLFVYNKHLAYSCDGYATIGCKTYTIEYWLENFEDIGRCSHYTSEEIAAYGKWLRSL